VRVASLLGQFAMHLNFLIFMYRCDRGPGCLGGGRQGGGRHGGGARQAALEEVSGMWIRHGLGCDVSCKPVGAVLRCT
jgi:hypothetical protein